MAASHIKVVAPHEDSLRPGLLGLTIIGEHPQATPMTESTKLPPGLWE